MRVPVKFADVWIVEHNDHTPIAICVTEEDAFDFMMMYKDGIEGEVKKIHMRKQALIVMKEYKRITHLNPTRQ